MCGLKRRNMGNRNSLLSSCKIPVNNSDVPDFADTILVYNSLWKWSQERELNFPPALIADIMEYSGSIPSLTIENNTLDNGADNADLIYLHSCLFTNIFFSPMRVIFEIESKDQGWSSYPDQQGTRNGSFTWGECAVVNRESILFLCNLYTNVHAGNDWETHHVEFDQNSELVQCMSQASLEKLSVDLQFHARSKYPGWNNKVKRARICVSWKLNNHEEIPGYLTQFRSQTHGTHTYK